MTNMPIRKNAIKAVKDSIIDLKNKLNKAKPNKSNLLRAHEDEDNSLLYHFRKYNKNKHYAKKKEYLAYQKFSCLNTKIRKLYD